MRVTASAALLALRMWWVGIVVLAVLGGAAGAYAVRDAPYTATTSLRVNTAGYGEVAQESIVETARQLVDSNRVYSKVAGDAPAAIEDLRQRTRVNIIGTSSILEINISAQTPGQAERDVDAIANASITAVREIAEQQFDATIKAGQDALVAGRLTDPVAENSRREGVGTAISAQQDNALRLSDSITRIGAVLPAVQTGLGSRMAMLIGALAGAVAASVGALLFGVGRRRIKRLKDMQSVAPGLVACEPLDYDQGLLRTAADCARFDHALVAVLALPGAEEDLDRTFDELRMELYRDGSRPFRIDTIDVVHAFAEERRRSAKRPSDVPVGQQNGYATPGGPPTELRVDIPALGMPKRAVDLDRAHADTLLIKGNAEPMVLRLIGGRADAILLVARARKTTLGHLAKATAALGEGRHPVVIISKPEPKTQPKLVDADNNEIGAAELDEPSILPPPTEQAQTPALEAQSPAAAATDGESRRWRPSPGPRPAMVGAAANGSAAVELTLPMQGTAAHASSSNGNGNDGASSNGSSAEVSLTKGGKPESETAVSETTDDSSQAEPGAVGTNVADAGSSEDATTQ